jgi:hypothetical protein
MSLPPTAPNTANPFSLPSDEEVFRLRDEERRNRAAAKEANASLKVWQKGHSKGRSLRMKDLQEPTVAAKSAVGGVVNERRQEKEIMTEFIAKKREMFLVQMSLDTKREEIRKLEEKAQMKEEALLKSEQMLEEDAIRFDTFLKENDKKAHEAIKKAEKETKLKTDKMQEIKKLNQQIQMVQSDMSKHKEALEDCLKYKEFLDKLTPPEWFERQKVEKRERQENRRGARIKVAKENWDAEKKRIYNEAAARHDAEMKAQQGGKEEKRRKRRADRGEGAATQINVTYPPTPKFDLEPLTSSGTEMPMYFTHPQQLLDVFTALEEQNLFLIQNSQETEQALDDLKATYKDTTKKMDEKTSLLQENIGDLKHQIFTEEQKANQLARRVAQSAGDTQDKQEALLTSLGEKVKNVYQRCGFDSSSNPSTLFMLSDLEAKLEDLLNALEQMPEEYVKKVEKEKEKKRRELKRAEQQAAQEAAQEERNRKAIERSLQPAKKRTGRQVMHRSQQVRRKAKEETKETTEEDMDEIRHLT